MNGTVEDPRAWRGFADGDLRTARILNASEDAEALAHITAFHAHESAENYLKGLLVVHGEDPPRIHALPALLQRTINRAPDLDRPEIRDAAINLNAYYVPSRYPAEVGGPEGPISAEDAVEALSWAEAIAAVVRPLLADGVR